MFSMTISEAFKKRQTTPATEHQELAEMAWLGAQHGRWEQPWSSVAEATPKDVDKLINDMKQIDINKRN